MNRIKQLRKKTGISQVELGEKICVAHSVVSKYENEQIPLSDELIRKLADFFDVTSDYLLCISDEELSNTQNSIGNVSGGTFVQGVNRGTLIGSGGSHTQLSPEELELLRVYATVDVKKRLKLINFALELEETNEN